LGPDATVIALQNSVEAEETLAGIIGRKHVMGGVAEISAAIDFPSVIRQFEVSTPVNRF